MKTANHRFQINLLGLLFVASVGGPGCNLMDSGLSADVYSEANLCYEIAEATCNNLFQCCTGLEIEEYLGTDVITTEQRCVHDVRLRCEERLTELIWAVGHGTATLNISEINRCLNAATAPYNTCYANEINPEWTQACYGVEFVSGLQPAANTCYWDFECIDDHFCTPNMTCRHLPVEQEDCSVEPCASGYFCAPQPESAMVCFEYLGQGEICAASSINGLLCEPEALFCDFFGGGSTGNCAVKKPLGASCSGSNECETGSCSPGYCDNNWNETCYEDNDCYDYGNCIGDSICVEVPMNTDYCDIGINIMGWFPNN